MADTDAGHWYLVCYDVRDAKRLRRCAKHLEGHGTRLQFSVFRCRLTATGMRRLQHELTTILEPVDSTMFIPLCERCVEGIEVTHSAKNKPDWPTEPPTHHIV